MILGVVAEVLGDVTVVKFDEDEDEDEAEGEENDLSSLDLGALSEKLNSLEDKPLSGLFDGVIGLSSMLYK